MHPLRVHRSDSNYFITLLGIQTDAASVITEMIMPPPFSKGGHIVS